MVPAQYRALVERAAAQYGIPADLLGRLLRQESGFDPDVISGRRASSAGALGIAQFMPATARERGVNPLDPESAIPGAASYLADLRKQFGGDLRSAVAAYNAGPGRVQSVGGDFSRLPAETRAYLAAIMPTGGATPVPPQMTAAAAPSGALPASTGAAPGGLLGGGEALAGLLSRQDGGLNPMAMQGLLALAAPQQSPPLEPPPLPQPYRPRVDLSRLQAMLRQA